MSVPGALEHPAVLRCACNIHLSPLLSSLPTQPADSSSPPLSTPVLAAPPPPSLPFRDGVSESCALVGVRVSPSGAYILLLFKGAPAELWTTLPPPTHTQHTAAAGSTAAAVAGEGGGAGAGGPIGSGMGPGAGGGGSGGGSAAAAAAAAPTAAAVGAVCPWRVRLVDLPFSAVEWVVMEDDMHKVRAGCGCGGGGGGRGGGEVWHCMTMLIKHSAYIQTGLSCYAPPLAQNTDT